MGISHLFFAGNIILFNIIETSTCDAMVEVLEKFCFESGQKISMDKSHIYFSTNVNENVKEKVYEMLSIQATRNIGKHLGFLINHRGVSTRQYNFIVERLMNKLVGWKAKFLSFAR